MIVVITLTNQSKISTLKMHNTVFKISINNFSPVSSILQEKSVSSVFFPLGVYQVTIHLFVKYEDIDYKVESLVLFSLTLLERQQLEQALQHCVTGTKSNNRQKWGH